MIAKMKLTFIWQEPAFSEREWIAEIFAPLAGRQVLDGQHCIVLDDCLLIDSYLHARPAEYYAQFRGRNAWLLHLSDETYEGGYDAYAHFRGVFRNYRSSVFRPESVLRLPLGYGDGLAHEPSLLAVVKERKLLWSFVGEANKASRPEMLRAFAPLGPQLLRNTESTALGPLSRREYQQTLLDSIFVPCPMGNVSLESFRIYEALECGAIPLLEKRVFFDYFTGLFDDHPLPTFINWQQAAKFVASIHADTRAQSELQQQCLAWWHGYKAKLSLRVEDFVAVTAGSKPESALNWQYRIPGWQTLELLRHQTLSTLSRRISLQAVRLIRERRLRKTFGK
jgi:hypothetical protein